MSSSSFPYIFSHLTLTYLSSSISHYCPSVLIFPLLLHLLLLLLLLLYSTFFLSAYTHTHIGIAGSFGSCRLSILAVYTENLFYVLDRPVKLLFDLTSALRLIYKSIADRRAFRVSCRNFLSARFFLYVSVCDQFCTTKIVRMRDCRKITHCVYIHSYT